VRSRQQAARWMKEGRLREIIELNLKTRGVVPTLARRVAQTSPRSLVNLTAAYVDKSGRTYPLDGGLTQW
jgi:hypothetical protein